MSDSTIARAMRTPISQLVAGQLAPISAVTTIRATDLPADVKALIEQVVRKTRLWPSERTDIANELIAHFTDGLNSGRSSQDLIRAFGDPRAAAKLMRRAKKRSRPIVWKVFVFACKSCTLLVGIYVATALLLALRQPNIAVDYMAKLNQPVAGIPVNETGRSPYLKAWASNIFQDGVLDDLLTRKTQDGGTFTIHRNDADWSKVHAWLTANVDVLANLRAAAAKPAMGFVPGSRADYSDAEAKVLGIKAQLQPDANYKNTPLIAALLPYLQFARRSAALLGADVLDAAGVNDVERAIADYDAIMNMARQTRLQPILINELVAAGMSQVATTKLAESNAMYPHLLDGRRVALLHSMAAPTSLYTPDFAGERMFLADVMQRLYSDDGHGDGLMTSQGLRTLPMFSGTRGGESFIGSDVGSIGLLPAAAALSASRAELNAEADRFYQLAVDDMQMPMWERHSHARMSSAMNEFVTDKSLRHRGKYYILSIMLPSLDRAIDQMDACRAQHSALMTALALDTYRERTGHYPPGLAELIPEYLPSVPTDLSTGQPLRYKLLDGKPVLYGLGWDGKDDGGTWSDKKTRYPRVPDTGDWVLYPPQEEP